MDTQEENQIQTRTPMNSQEARQFPFEPTLGYFRGLSRDESSPRRGAGPQRHLLRHSPTREEQRDSAYSSYSELPGAQKDDNTDHWAAMPLDRFTQNHRDPYINLIRSQLALLVQLGAWDPSKVRHRHTLQS